jgi:hypothetical protein
VFFLLVHATTQSPSASRRQSVTHNPRRLKGVNACQEVSREFATGDCIQFRSRDKQLAFSNRDLGTIAKVKPNSVTLADGQGIRDRAEIDVKLPGLDNM